MTSGLLPDGRLRVGVKVDGSHLGTVHNDVVASRNCIHSNPCGVFVVHQHIY
jgi:hypothetical protein